MTLGTPPSRRLAFVALAVLVVLAPAMSFAAPGAGADDGACPTNEGVTVVVDFQELGGGVQVRCASGTVTSGFDALTKAGFVFQPATRQPGFLCKIDDKPWNDPCQTASPASAYWSYWVAPRGGQWRYSDVGAGYRVPPAGTVEGWSFSQDKSAATAPPPPRTAVPAAVAPTAAAPPPSVAPAPGAASSGSAPGAAAAGRSPATSRSSAPPSPGVTTTAAPAPVQPTESSPTTTITATSSSEAPEVDVRDASTTKEEQEKDDEGASIDTQAAAADLGDDGADGGSPLGIVVAVALVAALGLGAFLRRRRANSD